MRFELLPFAGLLFALHLSGCCTGVLCEPCLSPGIYVRVVDATTEQPIEDATVTIAGAACPLSGVSGPSVYHCNVSPAQYTIDVAAPGHAAKQITVTLPEDDSDSCCSCGSIANADAALESM